MTPSTDRCVRGPTDRCEVRVVAMRITMVRAPDRNPCRTSPSEPPRCSTRIAICEASP